MLQIKPFSKKLVFKILATFFIFFLLIMVLFFGLRQKLLEQSIVKLKQKISAEYQATLLTESVSFQGLSGLQIENITLIPNTSDTLFHLKKLETEISLFKLITGKIQMDKLIINGGFFQGIKTENSRNFDAFLKKNKQKIKDKEQSNHDYAEQSYRLIDIFLSLIPIDLKIENLNFIIKDLDNHNYFYLNSIVLKDKKLKGIVNFQHQNLLQQIFVTGILDPRNKNAAIEINAPQNKIITLPYINKRWGLHARFKKLILKWDQMNFKQGIFSFVGSSEIDHLYVNHSKIASQDVIIKKAKFDFDTRVGAKFIQLDSASNFQMNGLKINLFGSFSNDGSKVYEAHIKIPTIAAQKFIEALPVGLFSNFEGMKASGTLGYSLKFKFNPLRSNELVFEPNVTTNQLKIISYGKANLSKMNNDFSYQAIENNVKQRAVLIGADNQDFTPIGNVSKLLENSVLTSEDPSFYQHAGFIQDAFKQSILKNFKENKFARGGSTISMQLVKNVFLTREKTISRKMEEIMLVYILEKKRIVPKSRMLEVYFNIIEWGPNVYGIAEVSRFYFQKTPSELNLKESLFLASIVPRPKKFMYFFDAEGKLKKFAEDKNNFIKNLMLQRGLIQTTDTIGYHQPLILSREAKSFIKQPKEKEIMEENILEYFQEE